MRKIVLKEHSSTSNEVIEMIKEILEDRIEVRTWKEDHKVEYVDKKKILELTFPSLNLARRN